MYRGELKALLISREGALTNNEDEWGQCRVTGSETFNL